VKPSAEQIEAVSDAHDGERIRAPRKRAAKSTEEPKKAPSAKQLRLYADRAVAAADRAEAREIINTARAHFKDLDRERVELERATKKNEKALEKARDVLTKLEGPGE
jgi:hypothetical protein